MRQGLIWLREMAGMQKSRQPITVEIKTDWIDTWRETMCDAIGSLMT
jgi:hypothetical protein